MKIGLIYHGDYQIKAYANAHRVKMNMITWANLVVTHPLGEDHKPELDRYCIMCENCGGAIGYGDSVAEAYWDAWTILNEKGEYKYRVGRAHVLDMIGEQVQKLIIEEKIEYN